MYSKNNTFIELCLNGEVDLEDIDQFVDNWHDSDTDLSLAAYLGLSDEEYELWVEKPQALRYVLLAHKRQISLRAALNDYDTSLPVAARAGSKKDAEEVVRWLEQTGRV